MNPDTLPEELESLVEDMARHVHDTWMRRRMAEGWTQGPRRDDRLLTHPCLTSYDSLPENEKDFDRATARATVNFILSNGFSLIPSGKHVP